jgi:hypothetical protein
MATEIHASAPTGTFVGEHSPYRFLIAATVIGLVVVLTAAVALFQLTQPKADAISVPAAQGETVDGWMPAIAAARHAATMEVARHTQDGWSSALLKPQGEAVDGWSSYLMRPEPAVVDGWSVRYLVADE